jgi:membrane-associated protein
VPIVRTFAPFVAGVGTMNYRRFISYNVIGALIWVGAGLGAGYAFGNIDFVKKNFSLVVIAIVLISLLPIAFEALKAKKKKAVA